MAELKAEGIDAGAMVSVATYAKEYLKVTTQAVDYAIKEGLVDYCVIGGNRFIVLTGLTRSYVPNKKRGRMAT